MKRSEKLIETQMNEDQKAHIEWIARRHGIEFLDHTMAMMVAARSGQQEILTYAASFSTADSSGQLKGLYLDPEDAKTAEGAYFVALHELGHSVLRHHNNGKDDVANEMEAWEWALSHCQLPPQEDETWEGIINALSTYTDNEEAEARPDSLLAISALPSIWKEKGWKFSQFKFPAMSGVDPVQLIDRDGNVTNVPQPLARMIAEYIQASKDYEKESFLTQMHKVFSDPDMAKRIEMLAKVIGKADAESLKAHLDEDYLKGVAKEEEED